MNSSVSSTAYKVSLSAILAALALIFSYIEALIPFNAGVPGIKLGIANLVILISLYTLGLGYTFSINLIRILVFRSRLFSCRRDLKYVCYVSFKENESVFYSRYQYGRRCSP